MKKKHLIALGALIGGGLLTYKLLRRKKKSEEKLPVSSSNPPKPAPVAKPDHIEPIVATPELPALPELPVMPPMPPAKVPNFGKGLPKLPQLPTISMRPPRITAELEEEAEARRGFQAGLGRIEKAGKKKQSLSGIIGDLAKKYKLTAAEYKRLIMLTRGLAKKFSDQISFQNKFIDAVEGVFESYSEQDKNKFLADLRKATMENDPKSTKLVMGIVEKFKAKNSKAKAKDKLSGVIDDLGKKYAIDGTDLAKIKKQLKAPSAKQIAKKSASNSEKIRELSKELNKLKRKTKAKAKSKPKAKVKAKPKAKTKPKVKVKAKVKPKVKVKAKAIAKTPSSRTYPLLAQIEQAGLKKKVAKPNSMNLIPTAREVTAEEIKNLNDIAELYGYREKVKKRMWYDLLIEKVPEKTSGIDFNREFWQYLNYYEQESTITVLGQYVDYKRTEKETKETDIEGLNFLDKVNEDFKNKALLFYKQYQKLEQLAVILYGLDINKDKYGERLVESKTFAKYSDLDQNMILNLIRFQRQYLANVRAFMENLFGALGEERAKKYLHTLRDVILEGTNRELYLQIFAEVSNQTDLSKCKVPPLKIPNYLDLVRKYSDY